MAAVRGITVRSKLAALAALALASLARPSALPAQDAAPQPEVVQQQDARVSCSSAATPGQTQPGQTAADADAEAAQSTAAAASESVTSDASQQPCETPAATPQFARYVSPSDLFSSEASAPAAQGDAIPDPRDTRAANLYAIAHPTNGKYPVTLRTGKWGGEEWEPAILQTLGFTIAQNGYRLASEQKTRRALLKETWHSYWLAVSGLHTWSDGGKTWTVYIAHPAQGAVFNDIWIEHDPHAALVPFGFNKVYWGEHIKSFWWDSVWELQWKFGPFSEASIGNVGLIPGKLGANTIVSSAFIGTGLSIGEDMLDRYGIAKWERHTDNRLVRAVLRSALNPDRSFANLFRAKYPWYRDRRPTLRDAEPPIP